MAKYFKHVMAFYVQTNDNYWLQSHDDIVILLLIIDMIGHGLIVLIGLNFLTSLTQRLNILFVFCTDSKYAVAIATATIVYMVFYFIALIWIFFSDYLW